MENQVPQLTDIQDFIDHKLSPGVQAHGGEIIVHSLSGGILTLSLSGACGSCGVQAYTSEAIVNYILEEFPQLDDVVIAED